MFRLGLFEIPQRDFELIKRAMVGANEQLAGPLSPGGVQQELISQRPGIYVLASILRAQDGCEQTQLGMERTIQIVR
jgi:hypothetical protein